MRGSDIDGHLKSRRPEIDDVSKVCHDQTLGRNVLKGKTKTSHDYEDDSWLKGCMADDNKSTPLTAWMSGFIERTRKAREDAKFTQHEMATILGVGQGTYKNYETNRCLPHQYIPQFCTATRVNEEWLFNGRTSARRPPAPERSRDPDERSA